MLGLEFNERGLKLTPALPMAEYEFKSALVGVRKTKSGYSGWYAPAAAGEWELEITLSAAERARVTGVKVNGVAQDLTAGAIRVKGESRVGKALRWELSWG